MRETISIGGATITVETGTLARQADGAAVVRHGDTMILATVVAGRERGDLPFFPLTVDYRERMSGAGRIPGGYTRREGPPNDGEVLASRLIDRALRPLFPAGMRLETQVDVTVFGVDEGSDLATLGIIAAGAALHVSDVPFHGPVVGIRASRVGGELVAMAPERDRARADVDVVCACTADGVVMLEGDADEASVDDVCNAIYFARRESEGLLAAVAALRDDAGRPRREHASSPVDREAEALADQVIGAFAEALMQAPDRRTRSAVDAEARAELERRLAEIRSDASVEGVYGGARKRLLRSRLRTRDQRLGGRAHGTIRALSCEVGYLSSNHGSALFTRGETQALVSATLATPDDSRTYETVLGRRTERFLLHYNFPSFAVGEAGRSLRPGRREIGHGALARRALTPVLPAKGDLPHAVRVVSDILGSDGSSSMATVCGASLAMMDAGVQLTRPVAGLAFGLLQPEDGGGEPIVLVDILGDEDAAFDMDMKVAGTERGVTALQMDNKRGSLDLAVLRGALETARKSLGEVLGVMNATLAAPRERVAENAPQVAVVKIAKSKVGLLIGPGGKTIQEIQQRTRSRIDVNDRGRVRIFAKSRDDLDRAQEAVSVLTEDLVRDRAYDAEVVSIKPYGAFVRIGSHEGLLHVSALNADGAAPESVVKVGETVRVKVVGANHKGQLELSRA